MDELEIDGKKYLSSRRAAKEHKYHIDYIGQLIRAGKVAGKKVGRSWYVEATSLKSYLSQEAGNPVPAQPVVEEVAEPTPESIAQSVVDEVPEAPAPVERLVESVVAPQKVEIKMAPPVVPHISAVAYEEEHQISFTTVQPVERKQNTVTYIEEDTEPMLPPLSRRVRANADFVAVPMRRVAEPTPAQESDTNVIIGQHFVPQKIKKNSRFMLPRIPRAQWIAVVAVAVLIVAAVGSTMLATSIKVGDGQAASVGVTLK